jgi:hypothetical protein
MFKSEHVQGWDRRWMARRWVFSHTLSDRIDRGRQRCGLQAMMLLFVLVKDLCKLKEISPHQRFVANVLMVGILNFNGHTGRSGEWAHLYGIDVVRYHVVIMWRPRTEHSSGYPEIRISGNPDIRISGFYPKRCGTFRISGYPDFRISGYPDIRKSRFPDIRKSGYPEIRISGYPQKQGYPCFCYG